MTTDPKPFTADELIRLSGTAIARVNREGARGTTLVTDEQIEAMATLLLMLGVPPIDAGTPPAALALAIEGLLPRLQHPLTDTFNRKDPDHV